MASVTLRTLLRVLAVLSPVVCASSQTVHPEDDTSSIANDPQFTLDTVINGMPIHPFLDPLTDKAGLAGSSSDRQAIQWNGPLFLTTPDTVDDLQPGNIAFISCEPRDYPGNMDAGAVMRLSLNGKPSAIVLYSSLVARCAYQQSGDFDFDPLYSMLAANVSQAIVKGLQSDNLQNPKASIHLNQDPGNGTSSGNGTVLGKSPTTAVAMIILYSITGIITALFLIIIVVGAIRAHRHPERYGPRHVMGRPRQSRAKGIARAMLDTLPITKFGDKEEDKTAAERGQDVEMGSRSANESENQANSGEGDTAGPTTEGATADGSDAAQAEPGETSEAATKQASKNPIDEGLACSVCTDDFVTGQDTRVLPCKHKFHPECIDPWLLNVSGTCPLCRIDLHPATNDEEPSPSDHVPSLEPRAPESTEESNVPAGANVDASRPNRRSRILSTLNIGRMRHATPQERLEALRSLRDERNANTEEAPRNRFSRRFSRALGSRPVSEVHSRPVSGIPPTAAGALGTTAETTDTQEARSPTPPVDRRRQGSFAG